MKTVKLLLLVFTLALISSACGSAHAVSTGAASTIDTSYTFVCSSHVNYILFGNGGASVAYNTDGTLSTC